MNVPSHTPVPCMSGQAGIEIGWPAAAVIIPAISAASAGRQAQHRERRLHERVR